MKRHLAPLLAVASAGLALSACGSADDAAPETTAFAVVGDHLTITKESGGDIELRPGDVEEVEVTRWFSGDAEEATWGFADDELILATDCGFLAASCEVRYQVTVPRDLAVTLDASNGDVKAAEFDTTLAVRTENGAITVADVSGDLTLHSTSGRQRATGLSSSDVQAQAENGEIDLAFSEAPSRVAVTTDNGAVTLRVPGEPFAVAISTDNGAIDKEITEDADAAAAIDVTTENGDIRLRTH